MDGVVSPFIRLESNSNINPLVELDDFGGARIRPRIKQLQ
jgi:hypothetical protein